MNTASVPLGEVAEFIRGITYKPADLVPNFSEGSIVCMRTANVQPVLDDSDLLSIPRKFVKNPAKVLREGDLLVSTANSWNLVGKCCWVPSLPYEATVGGFIAALRADPEKVDPRYFYRWFSSPKTQAEARNCGRQTTNISNMDIGRCLTLRLPLPPVPEQRRIAAILDKADALRAKRREAIAKLDQLLQSVFLDMFGDPNAEPASSNASMFLDAFVDASAGHKKIKQEDYLPEGTVPIVDQGQMLIGGYTHDQSMVSKAELPVIVFGDHTRCVKYVDFPFAVGADGVKVLRPRQEDDPLFLYSWLKYRRIPSAGYSRHFKFLKEARLLRPPLAKQRQFAAVARRIADKSRALQRQGETLDVLFRGLQQRAFSGTL